MELTTRTSGYYPPTKSWYDPPSSWRLLPVNFSLKQPELPWSKGDSRDSQGHGTPFLVSGTHTIPSIPIQTQAFLWEWYGSSMGMGVPLLQVTGSFVGLMTGHDSSWSCPFKVWDSFALIILSMEVVLYLDRFFFLSQAGPSYLIFGGLRDYIHLIG